MEIRSGTREDFGAVATLGGDVELLRAPRRTKPAWRAYEDYGFEPATDVLELEVAFACAKLLDAAYLAWDETYSPLSHDDWLAFMTENDSFAPECWFLADDGHGELVGVCPTWEEGWIKDLAVTAGARGRGLGESLLRHAFARLHERSVRRVGLKVDAGNPTGAVQLYGRVGMSVVERYRLYVKKL
jgi:GNAT superfamily N-acetyltransferase